MFTFSVGGCRATDEHANGNIQLSGTLEAREVNLAFQVGGRLSQLDVQEGDWVEQGRLLARIDPEDLQLNLQQAIATAKAAKANLDALKAGTRAQELRVAEAGLQKAQSQLNYAQAEVKRISFLVPKKLATTEQLEQSQLQYEIAVADVEQAQQNLNLLKEGPRREDIAGAQQEYEAHLQAIEILRRQLDYASLQSPVTGMVTVRLSETGEVVSPGEAIARIAELSKPWVRAYLSETDLGRVKLGQTATVTTDSTSGKTFTGRLSYISPVAEFTPKTVETRQLRVDLVYRVKVEVDNPDGALKIGMPADIELEPSPS